MFLETVKLFSKHTGIFYIPSHNMWGFKFFHIPVNTHCLFFLIIAVLVDGKWYLIVVLIYISLIIKMLWSFWMLIGQLYTDLFTPNFCPLSKWVICLFCCKRPLYSLNVSPLSDILFETIFFLFSSSHWTTFLLSDMFEIYKVLITITHNFLFELPGYYI